MVLFNFQTCKIDEFHPVHGRLSVTLVYRERRERTKEGRKERRKELRKKDGRKEEERRNVFFSFCM